MSIVHATRIHRYVIWYGKGKKKKKKMKEEMSKWVPVKEVLQLSLDYEHFVGASDFSNIPGYKLGNKKKVHYSL